MRVNFAVSLECGQHISITKHCRKILTYYPSLYCKGYIVSSAYHEISLMMMVLKMTLRLEKTQRSSRKIPLLFYIKMTPIDQEILIIYREHLKLSLPYKFICIGCFLVKELMA